MNMFSTGNPEEDELLRLLRAGQVTPELLRQMQAERQATQELQGMTGDPLVRRAMPSMEETVVSASRTPSQRNITGFDLQRSSDPQIKLNDSPQAQRPLPAGQPKSILSRLGDYVKENPDVAMAGLQSVGSLLSGVGAARGQKEADRATQERVARSNLIGALTGGKSRPQVAQDAPDAGFLGQLGGALQGAGQLGGELLKQRSVMNLKESELQRKIQRDATYAARVASQNDLTDAQIQNMIDRYTLAMSAEERMRFVAEFQKELGLGRLELSKERLALEVEKFGDQKAGRLFVEELQNRKQDLAEAYFSLSEADKLQAWDMAMKQFGLQEKKFELSTKEYDLDVKKAEAAEKEALATAAAETKREARKIVRQDLNNDILKRYVDSQNGLFPTYSGLNAAYANFVQDANTANMNAVFQMYQRLFDPATVREGDLEIQRIGQGLLLQAQAAVEKAGGGGFVLAKKQIDNMKAVADQYIESVRTEAGGKLDRYIDNFVLGASPSASDTQLANALRAYYGPIFGEVSQLGAVGGSDPEQEFGEGYGGGN